MVVSQLNKEDLLEVIKFQDFCRNTHVKYIEFYKKYPQEEKRRGKIAGDTKHHQMCIDGYDKTLKLLNKLKDDLC